jgi:cytochrome c1
VGWRVLVAAAAIVAGCRPDPAADQAGVLIARYGCQTCHVIPGAPQPQGITGPPLDQMARQPYVAGVVPNTPETLAAFIANPQAIDPRSAMPNLDVPQDEAAAIAAYLHEASR